MGLNGKDAPTVSTLLQKEIPVNIYAPHTRRFGAFSILQQIFCGAVICLNHLKNIGRRPKINLFLAATNFPSAVKKYQG